MDGRAVELSPVLLAQYARADRQIEYDRIADAFAQMVYCRTLPPDDAYNWTRVLLYEARMLELIQADNAPERGRAPTT